jgi:hypothetical protein
MKIHMDYLEGKIEQMQAQAGGSSDDQSQLLRQLELSQDKIKLIKDARAKEQKETHKKLEDASHKSL